MPLRDIYQRGQTDAYTHFKLAGVPLTKPVPHMSTPRTFDVQHEMTMNAMGARNRQHALEQHEPLMADVHMMADKHMAGLPMTTPPRPAVQEMPAVPAKPGLFSSVQRPRIGRTLALAGLGAAGAAAYGLHRANENDRQNHSLVYEPMQGSFNQ